MNWETWTKTKTSTPDGLTARTITLAKIVTYGARVMRNGRFSFHSIAAIPSPIRPCPDCDYKNLIVAGARHWQLPADYIRELESIQTV